MEQFETDIFKTAQPPVPEGMEQRLSRQIDRWNSIERQTARRTRIVGMRWAAGIAAGVALVAGIWSVSLRQPVASGELAVEEETFNDPDAARVEAEKALAKFSRSINKGLEIMDNATNKNGKK